MRQEHILEGQSCKKEKDLQRRRSNFQMDMDCHHLQLHTVPQVGRITLKTWKVSLPLVGRSVTSINVLACIPLHWILGGGDGEKVVEGIPGHLGKLGHRRGSAEQGERWVEDFGSRLI